VEGYIPPTPDEGVKNEVFKDLGIATEEEGKKEVLQTQGLEAQINNQTANVAPQQAQEEQKAEGKEEEGTKVPLETYQEMVRLFGEDAVKEMGYTVEAGAPSETTAPKEQETNVSKEQKGSQSQPVDQDREALLAQIEELKKQVEAADVLKEYLNNPLAFRAKYEPYLFEQFDKGKYVKDKLAEEFGEGFIPDPTQALLYGTKDYDYVARQRELIEEANNYVSIAQMRMEEEKKRQEEQARQEYDKVMSSIREELKIDDKVFESEVKSRIEQLQGPDILKELVKGMIAQKQLEQMKSNTPPPNTGKIPSVITAPMAGDGVPQLDENEQKLLEMFGGAYREVLKQKGKII